jgi:hypothetical protein
MRMNVAGSFRIATTRWTVLGNRQAIQTYRRSRRCDLRCATVTLELWRGPHLVRLISGS